jgi:hypothetical protein
MALASFYGNDRLNSAPSHKVSDHTHSVGLQFLKQSICDDVDYSLMANSLTAEAVDIELKVLQFHNPIPWDVVKDDTA